MKVGVEHFKPEADFLAMEKDSAIIIKKILSNDNITKMLYYTQKDCLKGKSLTPQQKLSLIDTKIKIVPKLKIDENCPTCILLLFSDFAPNETNPQFLDYTMAMHVICHPDHWDMGNFQLRPYKIAGELNAMFSNKKLTGIGETQFLDGYQFVLDEYHMGITLVYRCIHGTEDKINPLS